jgi:hypothetical protein
MATIRELLAEVDAGGEPADEVARTLGLLLEGARRPLGPEAILLPVDWRDRRLTEDEVREAVDGLLDHVRQSPEPSPTAVWALAKRPESRIVAPLVALLRRVMADERQEELAYQALTAIIVASPGSGHEADVLAAVWEAASRGHGRVADIADEYLLARP